ncbi:MAG TPA: alkaline phosphatase family protein [Stellaceae bacterium]|nr:alkaline phosphatase family protein [Stellaceae bacterium]
MAASDKDDPVRHVVLLILENHSFDKMLGCFREVYADLDGIDPGNPRINLDDKGRSYAQAPTTERQVILDPHHEVPHVATQLTDHNGGFVLDFARSYPDCPPEGRAFIMGYYPRGFLPALHALASDFTICDRWHAALPGPTWPNRFFALSGTSLGRVNMPDDGTHKTDLAGYFQQTQDTIFDRLTERNIHWKVYFHDVPQTTVFTHQREPHNAARYFYIDEFFDDARGLEAAFPQFSLIEPSYIGWRENDDHPPHDVMRAEKLIADVYNAIRANDALWQSTLLVVFYDEHGGFYDHVEPPPAAPPDDHHEEYSFDRLGVRVPAVLVSPWVDKRVEHTLFDHTSVLRYLIDKWHLGSLGRRTEAAKSIGVALLRGAARTDTIARIRLTDDQLRPPDPEAAEKAFDQPSAHQTALRILAAYLKDQIVTDAPRAYSWMARRLEGIKDACNRLLDRIYGDPPATRISIAEPDRLAHHADARPRDDVAHFLMHRKRQAVAHLGAAIHDAALSQDRRSHALQTLALITGRAYDREENGAEHAKAWLHRHSR